jgi:hypothetical protein
MLFARAFDWHRVFHNGLFVKYGGTAPDYGKLTKC